MKGLFVLAVAVALTGCGGGGSSQGGSGQEKQTQARGEPDRARGTAVSLDGVWEVSRTGRRIFSNPHFNTDIHSTHRMRVSDGRIRPLTEDDVLCGFDLPDFAEIANNRVSYRKFGVACTMDERNYLIYSHDQVGEVCIVNTWMDLFFNGNRFQGELSESIYCNGWGSSATTELEGTRQ